MGIGVYKKITYGGRHITLVDYPSSCPVCHNGITPVYISADNQEPRFYVFMRCPSPNCHTCFTTLYFKETGNQYTFKYIVKPTALLPAHSQEINTVSEGFTRIFNQAYTAEQFDLLEIAGVGYRKALEHLIKDYLIGKQPDDRSTIESMSLGNCISHRIDNPQIKSTAKRAVWLGNDEAHFIRRWEDKDIHDLKDLIQLTVKWIEMEAITRRLEQEMPDRS